MKFEKDSVDEINEYDIAVNPDYDMKSWSAYRNSFIRMYEDYKNENQYWTGKKGNLFLEVSIGSNKGLGNWSPGSKVRREEAI